MLQSTRDYITLVDSKGTDLNGFTWQGETELEGVIKNKENTQIRLKLCYTGELIPNKR